MSVLSNLFDNIAATIRTKSGGTEPIKAANFPSAILSLDLGVQLHTATATISTSTFTIPELIGRTNFIAFYSGNFETIGRGTVAIALINGAGTYSWFTGSYYGGGTANVTLDATTGTVTCGGSQAAPYDGSWTVIGW